MMDDICDKLVRFGDRYNPKICTSSDLKVLAAAEITRLRAENKKLRAVLVETLDYIDDPYDEFYIEIGQLLESLEAAALKETWDE